MSQMFRMPIGFGPSLGPRQGPDGRRYTGEPIRTNLLTASYRTTAAAMAEVLPAPFRPADDPVVTVRMLHNLGFPWLAGRTYNYFEVLFRAVHQGRDAQVEGEFVAVMWESMADPIIVGREEVGHPKLFADVTDPTVESGDLVTRASWEGFEFGVLRLSGVELDEWPYALEESAPLADRSKGIAQRPRFNYKYFPSTTVGASAVDEVLMIPAGVYEQKILSSWQGEGCVSWNRARWEDLPTFSQVVNGIEALPQEASLGATLTQVVKYTNDLRDELTVLE